MASDNALKGGEQKQELGEGTSGPRGRGDSSVILLSEVYSLQRCPDTLCLVLAGEQRPYQ